MRNQPDVKDFSSFFVEMTTNGNLSLELKSKM